MEAFADGLLIGPELFGHGFINDGDRRGVFAVGIGEEAATKQRNAQSIEISRGDVVQLRQRSAVAGGFVLAFRKNGSRKAAAQGEVGGNGRGLHAGRGIGAFDGGAQELLAVAFVVMQRAEVKGQHEEIF